MSIKITRFWSMPSADTYSITPIKSLVRKYLSKSKFSIDVFARNSNLATITNDMNPDTTAQFHLESIEFLELCKSNNYKPDLILFDPPYSMRQVKECYSSIGIKTMPFEHTHGWTQQRDLIRDLLIENGICISFGWNSQGIGLKRGFEIVEILLINHGREHNDTICTVERKKANLQANLWN